ncbi:MAG: hypothetical protein JOY82_11790 [Streptosporangiaceae bacterium]|nr:hypothetical protein [Streptosporangiaceae bacterium]MBV9855180.1 hypothetical protein [Streptosporangiaceae bacterium]
MTTLSDRAETALSARPLPGLSRLIDPVDVATFQRVYWEQRPLVVHREDPCYYAGLLTLDDIDQILNMSNVLQDNVRVVMNGKETPVSELVSSGGRNARANALEELYAHYRDGSTIVLNALELRWEPLAQLARSVGAELSAKLQMNIYLTPAGSQGFAAHYDTHDVFVAQVHGSKQWRAAAGTPALPLMSQPYDKSQPEPSPDLEFQLNAGDVVYLPRGTVHWATSNATASAHITIGVHPFLYEEVLVGAIKKVFAEDVRFRGGLPIGFAADEALQHGARTTVAELIDVLRMRLSPADMVAEAVTRAASLSTPPLRHHLTDLEELGELWVDTRVRRRAGQQSYLTVSDDSVRLHFSNKAVGFPIGVAPQVRYVAENDSGSFTANDIPGDLDEPGRLVLVQTLLREGFLTVG